MIQQRILGAWELVSFIAALPDGRAVSPMGRHAGGSILYTPEYASVNLTRGDRPRPMPEREFHHLPAEVAGTLAIGYMAYAGPYSID